MQAAMCDALGDREGARSSWAAALDLARVGGDAVGEAYGLAGLALAAMPTDHARAVELLERAIPLASTADEPWLHALCLIWLGALRSASGAAAEARPVLEQALASTRARDDRMITCVALINLAQASLALGQVEESEAHLAECVSLSAAMATPVNMEISMALLAVTAARRGHHRRAATLLGAVARMRDLLGAPIHESYLFDARQLELTDHAVRAALGEEAYQYAVLVGSQMDLAGAASYVSAQAPSQR